MALHPEEHNSDHGEKKKKAKSLLSRIMSFGARDKAASAPREKFLSNKKKRQFKKAFKKD